MSKPAPSAISSAARECAKAVLYPVPHAWYNKEWQQNGAEKVEALLDSTRAADRATIERLTEDVAYWKSHAEESDRELCALQDGLGCPPEREGAIAKGLERLRDLIAAEGELGDAKELLREIRDGEVNPEDEADKFLRDHTPSTLSDSKQTITRLEAELAEAKAQSRRMESLTMKSPLRDAAIMELEEKLAAVTKELAEVREQYRTELAPFLERAVLVSDDDPALPLVEGMTAAVESLRAELAAATARAERCVRLLRLWTSDGIGDTYQASLETTEFLAALTEEKA